MRRSGRASAVSGLFSGCGEGFTRRIYINAYRYSLHMLPKSLLIEVGAQTNTKEEVLNSMDILAEILADVIKPK